MSKTEIKEICLAIAEAIRELKQVPSGHLYARLMGRLSLEEYNLLIGFIQRAGLIKIQNHLITWIGE